MGELQGGLGLGEPCVGKRPGLSAGTAVTWMQKEGILAGSLACRSGKLVAAFSC